MESESESEYKYMTYRQSDISDTEMRHIVDIKAQVEENSITFCVEKKSVVLCSMCNSPRPKNTFVAHLLEDHYSEEATEWLKSKIIIRRNDRKCKIRGCRGRLSQFSHESYIRHLLLFHGFFRKYLQKRLKMSIQDHCLY